MQVYSLGESFFFFFLNIKISSAVLRIKYRKETLAERKKILSCLNLNKIVVSALNSGVTRQNR